MFSRWDDLPFEKVISQIEKNHINYRFRAPKRKTAYAGYVISASAHNTSQNIETPQHWHRFKDNFAVVQTAWSAYPNVTHQPHWLFCGCVRVISEMASGRLKHRAVTSLRQLLFMCMTLMSGANEVFGELQTSRGETNCEYRKTIIQHLFPLPSFDVEMVWTARRTQVKNVQHNPLLLIPGALAQSFIRVFFFKISLMCFGF